MTTVWCTPGSMSGEAAEGDADFVVELLNRIQALEQTVRLIPNLTDAFWCWFFSCSFLSLFSLVLCV